jgi:NADPH:quinone reductase-like Zn-dependent oxidoreductase
LVLDTIGGETQERSWQLLNPKGFLVATLGITSPKTARQYGVSGNGVSVRPDPAQLTQIAGLINAGKVKPAVSQVLPLAQAVLAHELSQAGHVRGKIVLQVRD